MKCLIDLKGNWRTILKYCSVRYVRWGVIMKINTFRSVYYYYWSAIAGPISGLYLAMMQAIWIFCQLFGFAVNNDSCLAKIHSTKFLFWKSFPLGFGAYSTRRYWVLKRLSSYSYNKGWFFTNINKLELLGPTCLSF